MKKMNKNSKQRMLAGFALLVVVLLVASCVFVYFEFYKKEKTKEEEPTKVVIDNRISPLEEQGFVLEVLRIRDRGLLEELLKPGDSWKTKPTFYFVTNMDGLEYNSKYVEQHGKVVEIPFHTWDTMFQENKIMRNVDPENKTATATLTIWETIPSGILGRKTTDVKRDSLTVTYDFRTGRWSGDDNFKDSDGYGHYLGKYFEIWFNLYQFDYDNDFIPYWTEVNILHTDPTVDDSKLDPDGDGIPTAWEWKWGYDPFTWDDHANLDPDMDGLSNLEEYQMAKWFANPFSQDIYLEVDFMGRGGPLDPAHILYEETKQGLIERFAEHNIKLYVDDGWPDGPINGGGEILPHYKKMSQDSGMMLQFYLHHFADERKGIFRYMVLGHGGGFSHPSKNNIYDTIQLLDPTGIFSKLQYFITIGYIPTARGERVDLGASMLHELAHSCAVDADLCHFGGIDNVSYGFCWLPNKNYLDTWGQYRSVLNYLWMYKETDLFDLSDGKNGPPYDQNDWSMMFAGHFQLNSKLVEEPFYKAGQAVMEENEWWVPGYEKDANLTEEFKQYIGDWTPVDPKPVTWVVYKLIDKEKNPNYREIKVFAKIDTKNVHEWTLSQEGDLDSKGNLQFYSFDDILKERIT